MEQGEINYERKMRVKQSLLIGEMKRREFLDRKRQNALNGKSVSIVNAKEEISIYENEAEALEKEEAYLISQLQVTQENEVSAINELKNAMMHSSLPQSLRA